MLLTTASPPPAPPSGRPPHPSNINTMRHCVLPTNHMWFCNDIGSEWQSSCQQLCWVQQLTPSSYCKSGLQGYILVLWGCEVGLLGLGYLALLIGVFTYPPIRGRWNRLEEGGVEVDENHQSSSSGQPCHEAKVNMHVSSPHPQLVKYGPVH